MRHAPTSSFVVAALLVGAGLLGCAADATEPATRDLSPTDGTPVTSNDSDDGGAPAFNAEFDGDGGTRGDASTPTTTGGTCSDPNDPGATELLATKLDDTDDCNNDLIEHTGTLLNATDADMYKLAAKDKTFCELDTTFQSETAGTQLCVFARCQNATANPVSGCSAGTEATSDLGWKGCCATGPGEATPKWDCSGITDDDSADFYIRIKPTTSNSCVKYAFKYRF